MQADGLADIESQFVQGGSLRDHGEVETLGHKLVLTFVMRTWIVRFIAGSPQITVCIKTAGHERHGAGTLWVRSPSTQASASCNIAVAPMREQHARQVWLFGSVFLDQLPSPCPIRGYGPRRRCLPWQSVQTFAFISRAETLSLCFGMALRTERRDLRPGYILLGRVTLSSSLQCALELP